MGIVDVCEISEHTNWVVYRRKRHGYSDDQNLITYEEHSALFAVHHHIIGMTVVLEPSLNFNVQFFQEVGRAGQNRRPAAALQVT